MSVGQIMYSYNSVSVQYMRRQTNPGYPRRTPARAKTHRRLGDLASRHGDQTDRVTISRHGMLKRSQRVPFPSPVYAFARRAPPFPSSPGYPDISSRGRLDAAGRVLAGSFCHHPSRSRCDRRKRHTGRMTGSQLCDALSSKHQRQTLGAGRIRTTRPVKRPRDVSSTQPSHPGPLRHAADTIRLTDGRVQCVKDQGHCKKKTLSDVLPCK